MKKRFLALLLCCAMVFGMMPGSLAQAFAAESDAPAICYNGSAADSVDLPQNEKILLTVSGSAADYQWQIEDFTGEWANIAGSTGSALRLSYAMVANLLDGGEVSLRCRVTGEDGVAYTDPVTVTVTAPAASAPARFPSLGEILGDTFAEGSQAADDQLPAADPAIDPAADPAEGDNSSSGDESEITEPWTIIIKYIFTDGTEAAAPWTASVARDINYSTTVTSPTVVGYEPYQKTVEISVTPGETPETTYTVTYYPAEVTFTVNHWLQNVNDNGYTLDTNATVEAKGLTGSEVGDSLANSYDGFYSLLYDTTTTIAADGSTVVDVYYDRLYYLISFDLDGGYGVEPIYARYGADIEVDDPQRAGYTFTGWDREIPATVPAFNRIFKARWTPADTAKVTVVIWGENANDEDYSYIKSSEIQVKPGTTLTKDDLTHILTCDKEVHQHTNSCMNCAHTHTSACYGAIKQEQPVDGKTHSATENINQFKALTGGTLKNGMVYRVKCDGATTTKGYDKYYLYYDNTWYLASSEAISGKEVAVSDKVNAHEHRMNWDNDKDQFWVYNAKLSCVHTHTDSCYICGKAAHKHNANCYTSPLDMDATLWKLVKSDEVTVAADGTTILNVYYDRTVFTLTFRANGRTVATIQEKWGAEISKKFSQAPFNTTYNGRAWKSNKYSYALQTLDRMPAFDATFNLYNKNSNTKKTIYYYVQDIGTTVNGEWPTSPAGFTLLKTVDTYFNYATYDEEYHTIVGFTRYSAEAAGFTEYGNPEKSFTNNELYLYYMRDNYTLRFYNYTDKLDKEATVPYEDKINKYTFEPDYPKDLEEGAYTFEGWYTDQFFHNKVTDATTMPAGDTIIFARWVPNTHTVRTFLTADSTDPLPGTWEKVPHGSVIADPPGTPERGGYKFVGWFYLDNGQEKAFDFSMPINRDLDLYAKWSSNVLVQYTIHYKLEDGTTIAPDTTGSGLAGSSKTFDAKVGTQLNAGYQEGYFPTTSSHSLVLKMADEGTNEFTFYYVKKDEVNYTVRYLDKATGEPVVVNGLPIPDKHATTSKVVVTEEYERITGYRPDAYQKSLILSADEEENVLIFWYTVDNVHAPVHIIHWTQNITGDGYTQHLSYTDLDAIIGSTREETPLNIPGFTYNAGRSKASGEVPAEGLVLNLYYDRIEYPYEFRFLEQGTNKELADPVKSVARYQARVTQTAPEIPGYTLVSAKSQTIQIAIEAPANLANKNVRIFYYTEQTVDIEYKVVGPTGCGTLDNYKESLKVITGEAKGSTPTAAPGFKFVGWYTTEDCIFRVDDVIPNSVDPTTNKLTPQKRPNSGHYAATYYAKFEYDVTDLTITKQGWNEIDENQTFLFDVTGPNGYSTRVAIVGKGSVTISGLKVGTYTVTEVGSWSWRYLGPYGTVITLDPTTENKVTIRNTRQTSKWLSGDTFLDNLFKH